MSIKNFAVATTLVIGMIFANFSFAIIVFDPSNLFQSIMNTVQTTKTALEAIQQTRQQIATAKQTYDTAMKMKNDARGVIMSEVTKVIGPELAGQLQSLDRARQDIQKYQKTLSDLNDMYKSRADVATKLDMTLAKFLDARRDLAAQGNLKAIANIKEDQAVIQKAQKSAEAAQQWQSQIGDLNTNLNGSMQLMNTQISKMVTGNAEMLAYMAATNIKATKKETDVLAQGADYGRREAEMRQADINTRKSNFEGVGKSNPNQYSNPFGKLP